MKTNELIKLLQENDPSGELDCCIGNAAIYSIEVLPAYYDGCLQVLVQDPALAPYYDVVGAKYTTKGSKLSIRSLSVYDAISDNVNLPIEYDLGSEERIKRYKDMDDERRAKITEIHNECNLGSFLDYVYRRYLDFDSDFPTFRLKETLSLVATEFFNEHLVMDYDKIPQDILDVRKEQTSHGKTYEVIPSWNDRKTMQWDREISLDSTTGKLVMKGKT